MRYTEVNFLVNPVEPWRDVLMVELTEVGYEAVSYTHLRAHETVLDLVCRLLLEIKNNKRSI